jgi:GH35 family endo-1,4-beta-xylanase
VPGTEGRVRLDLNSPPFQEQWFALSKEDGHAVLTTLRKVSQRSWHQVYTDHRLKWEAISSRRGPVGERLYSFRCGRALRAVAYRDGDFLRLLTLHPDHDSAYR